jgi:diguanylate cyclase (GGDEF)-like protein
MGVPPSLRGRYDQERVGSMTPTEGPGRSLNGDGSGRDDALERSLLEQTLTDSEQTLSDTDQTLSDTDQARSDLDQASADEDQHASDLDQAAADREYGSPDRVHGVYASTRADRVRASDQRHATAAARARMTDERLGAARTRDLTAQARDLAAAERDQAAAALEAASTHTERGAARRLAALRARGAHDRERAAEDRAAAARDRADAAEDRTRAAIELRHAYHDDLTGALRREMGEVALQHELERARRGDGRLVLAFVDVDKLKLLNDREGHVAGDALLQAVVAAMRAKLRSFDPVVRYGGDEFVCALAGTDGSDATRRFEEIQANLARSHDDAAISVGVVELTDDETLDDLIARGDAALYQAKGRARRGSVEPE